MFQESTYTLPIHYLAPLHSIEEDDTQLQEEIEAFTEGVTSPFRQQITASTTTVQTKKDPVCQKVREYSLSGWPDKKQLEPARNNSGMRNLFLKASLE